MNRRPVVTLTTDFGLKDHFVGVLKGVILSINPEAQLADLSHEVNPHDIWDGAWTIALAYRYFPAGSIHLAVVDPGVGSERRPILVQTAHSIFVVPDNGLLSAVYAMEPQIEVREITADRYFLKPVSRTFHGRDIFAPVAGWLSTGIAPSSFGSEIADYIRFEIPRPKQLGPRAFEGTVIKIDRFGNLITNLSADTVPGLFSPSSSFTIQVAGRTVSRLAEAYSAAQPDELVALAGSSGFLEIARNRGSAAAITGAEPGTAIALEMAASPPASPRP